ncbi:hypothetical protein AC1031_000656 [Aphanomyces cochlioides]|nr:hypothetical protein AC1031_000656 [Aphanomyces cochlioides]
MTVTSFDPQLILLVPEDQQAAYMAEAYKECGRLFVEHAFRPYLSYSLQKPHESSLPLQLKKFLEQVDVENRHSLTRIGLEELGKVQALSKAHDTDRFTAIRSFLDICPMDLESIHAFIEYIHKVDTTKDIRARILKCSRADSGGLIDFLDAFESNLNDNVKVEFFFTWMQVDSIRYNDSSQK